MSFLSSRRIVGKALHRVCREACVLVVGFLLILSSFVCFAATPPDEQQYDIDIPALNAALALNRLAEQTGAILLFPYDIAEARQANVVVGRYTLMDALDNLLQGSGLSGGLSDKRAIQITLNKVSERKNEEGSMAAEKVPFSNKFATFFASVFFATGSVGAQTGEGEEDYVRQIEEVIVTAQKREQSLQDVPIAISAFNEDFLRDNQITDMQDLYLYTPGYVAQPGYDFIGLSSLRGIRSNDFGYGGDPAFGVFVDGVYQGRTGASISSMFDIARIEVIKGPQATLFGRSATAGAISMITNKPNDTFGGTVELGLGERGRQNILGTINLPISDNLFFRGSYYSQEIDGFIDNPSGGDDLRFRDNQAFRLALRYEGESLSAQLTYNNDDRKGSGMPRHPGNTTDFDSDLLGTESRIFTEIDDYALHLEYEFNDNYSLLSTTSYRDSEWDYAEDFDALPIALVASPFLQGQVSKLFAQEIRLSASFDSGLSWFVGASYFKDDVTGFVDEQVDQGFAFTGDLAQFSNEPFFEGGRYDGTSEGWSIYGDIIFDITDSLEFTIGARHSYDEKRLQTLLPNPATDPRNTTASFPCACYLYGLYTSTPVESEDDWTDTSYRTVLNYQITDEISTFFSYSQGFKSGGIDSFGFDTDDPNFPLFTGADGVPAGARPKVYGPEEIDSFEIGIKSQWLDRRLTFNASLYRYEYEGLQTAVSTSGAAFGIENVGEVIGEGLEVDVMYRLNKNWEFAANMGLSDTEITDVGDGGSSLVKGDSLLYNADLTGSVFATYRQEMPFGGEAYLKTNYSYFDEMDTSNGLVLDSYGLINMRLGYYSEDERWSAAVFVNNVSDETYFTNGYGERSFVAVVDLYGGLGVPRTAGVDFKYNF